MIPRAAAALRAPERPPILCAMPNHAAAVALEVPTHLVDRLRRLAAVQGESVRSLTPLVVRALQAGLADFADAQAEANARAGQYTADGVPVDEAHRLVRRDGQLALGSRRIARRSDARGGRRQADQPQTPPRLVDQVLALVEAGVAAREVADQLDQAGHRTPGGRRWSAAAVQQLVRLETDRRAGVAWTPAALAPGDTPP